MADTTRPKLLPSTRLALAFACFFGCFVTYTLRTNLSFAIVCMVNENKTGVVAKAGSCDVTDAGLTTTPKTSLAADDLISDLEKPAMVGEKFNWDKAEQGTLLGAFFYGYLGSQVLGGYLATRFGGKRVILVTILGSALLTMASPVAARTSLYSFALLRAMIGFLQGATFPAMHCMWSVWAPPMESSLLTSITYAGAQIGNVVVLPLSGFLCQSSMGWPSIFYVLGAFGVVWSIGWVYISADRPATHPRISEDERKYIVEEVEKNMGKSTDKPLATPWLKIVTSLPVWACWVGHFAGDWGAYTLLMALPTFLKDVLNLDLSSLGILSAIPYIAYFVMINVGGYFSDFIRSRHILNTLNTRRAAMLLALIGQAVFLVASGYCGCGQQTLVIMFITLAMAISGLQYSGFVVNYLDIAPPFSGTVMGIGNTLSCLSGIVTPMVTSFLVQNGEASEWRQVLWVTAGVLCFGATFFSLFASGEVQPWAKTTASTEEEVPLQEQQKA